MVQCPELCGRIASSLTSRPPVARSGTAPPRAARPRRVAAAIRMRQLLGGGGELVVEARRRRDTPRRRCRRAARSPPPARPPPARTASGPPARPARGPSRRAPRPAAGRAARAGRRPRRRPSTTKTPRAVVAPARCLQHDRPAVRGGERRDGGDRAHLGPGGLRLPRRGQRPGASPACPGRARARPGPGRTGTPSSSRVRRCSVGTCSWSKVSTVAPSATRRSAARSPWSPSCDVGGRPARRIRPARRRARAATGRARWPPGASSGPAVHRPPWRRPAVRCGDPGALSWRIDRRGRCS